MNPAAATTTSKSSPRKAPSLKEMAGAAKSDRNRAVDLYRAVAMLMVAFGHWAAIAIGVDGAGELYAGNALEYVPSLQWLTWILQVMPLFFVVGGFSSGMSLDKHNAEGGRPQDWVVARLRRMVAPTILLAGTWLIVLAGGAAIGQWELVALGAVSAAIPLWFLANYTIDTAIAPYVLPRFRRNPKGMALGAGAVYLSLEALRFADVSNPFLHALPKINWVLGWLMFQVTGFAWRDGLLPSGRKLLALAGVCWAGAVAAVALGPWPVAMVHFPGLENSPTHPPSLALMLFGFAYSFTALAAAPAVSRFLGRSPKAWAAVVGANAVAMSVYLWHMTAAIFAVAIFHALGALPTAVVGTAAWWIQKLPIIGLALVLLVGIVGKVSKTEQRALLAPRTPFAGGQVAMLFCAAALSTAMKLWANGSITEATISMAAVLVLWNTKLKSDSAGIAAPSN